MPGKSHGQRSLVGYSPRGRKGSDTTERLHFTSLSLVVTNRGYSAVAVWRLQGLLVAEHGSAQEHKLNSCGACMGLVALRQCEIFPDQGFTLICVFICQYNLTTVICKVFDLKNNILHHNPTYTHTYIIYIYTYKSETKVLPKTSTLHINFLRPLPVF